MPPADTPPPSRPSLDRIARIIYGAILAVPILFTAVIYAIRPSNPAASPDSPVLLYTGLGIGAFTFGLAMILRGRLDAPGGDRLAWWKANLPKAVAIWGALEAGGLAQGVLYLMSGQALLLAGVAMFFLFPMSLTTPGNLSGT